MLRSAAAADLIWLGQATFGQADGPGLVYGFDIASSRP